MPNAGTVRAVRALAGRNGGAGVQVKHDHPRRTGLGSPSTDLAPLSRPRCDLRRAWPGTWSRRNPPSGTLISLPIQREPKARRAPRSGVAPYGWAPRSARTRGCQRELGEPRLHGSRCHQLALGAVAAMCSPLV